MMFVGSVQGINRESKGKLPDRLPARTAIRILNRLLGLSSLPLVWRSCRHTGGRGKSTLIFERFTDGMRRTSSKGGLNGSMQHLLGVYWPEFQSPKFFLDVD
jgi:hypothetical protein